MHEAAHCAAGAIAPPLEDDLVEYFRLVLGVGAVDHLSQFLRQQRCGLGIGDTLPLALPPFAGAQQRRHDAVGVVDMQESGVALGAELAAGIGMIHVAFEFDDAAVLHIGHATVFDIAGETGVGYGLSLGACGGRKILAAQLLLHRYQSATGETGSPGRRTHGATDLHEIAAGVFQTIAHRSVSLSSRSG